MRIRSRINQASSKNLRRRLVVVFFAIVTAFLLTVLVGFGIHESAVASEPTPNSSPGSLPVSGPMVSGPQFYVGCDGNQTVLIQYGNHPANTSSVLHTPIAQLEANDTHVFCDNNGNLINSINGQIIPVTPPTAPTPLVNSTP